MATYPNVLKTFAANMFAQKPAQTVFGATSQLFTPPPPPNPYQPQRPRMSMLLQNQQGLKPVGQQPLDDGTYSSKMLGGSGGLV